MRFITAVLSVSFLLLLGRLSGFVREWLIARFGGASEDTDIAIVLITLPDLMVTVLIGGGFSAAIVPILQKLPPAEASRMFMQLSLLCGGIFLGVALVIMPLSQGIMHMLSPGVSEAALTASAPLFMLVALAIPLAGLSGTNQARLVSHELFWLSQSGTIVFNLTIIAAILSFGQTGFLSAIAFGVLAGALGRIFLQYLGIWKKWTPPVRHWLPMDSKLFKDLILATVFSAVIALLPVIGRAFASSQGSGGLSLFSYAFRLVELPIALVFAALSTVFLPHIAVAYKDGERERGAHEIMLILRFSLLLGIAMIIPVLFFARDFLLFIFSTTPLTPSQIDILQAALITGFVFMPFRGLMILTLPILAAAGKTRMLPLPAALAMVSMFLISPLTTRFYGVPGAMAGYGLAHFAACLVFFILLVPLIGLTRVKQIAKRFGSCYLMPVAACAALCWLGQRWTDGVLAAFLVSALAMVMFGGLLVVNDNDAGQLLRNVARRIGFNI